MALPTNAELKAAPLCHRKPLLISFNVDSLPGFAILCLFSCNALEVFAGKSVKHHLPITWSCPRPEWARFLENFEFCTLQIPVKCNDCKHSGKM